MLFKQTLSLALRSLKINKIRSFLTMLGVIIGVSSVILLVSLGTGLQKYITDQLKGVGSNLLIIMPGKFDLNKMGESGGSGLNFMTSKLEVRDARDLGASPLIKVAVPGTAAQAAVKYGEQKMYVEVNGVSANFYEAINSPLSSGDYFSESDDRAGRKVIILGSDIAKKLFPDSDPIGERVTVGEGRFTVVGVLKNRGIGSSSMQDTAVIPITTAMRVFNQEKVSVIYAEVISSDWIDETIAETKLILSNRLKEDEFTIITQQEMLGAVSSILGVLTTALVGIAAISLLVGGIGIMNIMLVSVTERTREIGLRKALGATPTVILYQFLTEAVILSVGGGVAGIILGGGGALVLSRVMPAQVTVWAVFLAFGVSVLVGVIFGVMPARKASKMQPIEALRYE